MRLFTFKRYSVSTKVFALSLLAGAVLIAGGCDGNLGDFNQPAMNEGPWPPPAPMAPPSEFSPQQLRFTQISLVTEDGRTFPLPSMFKSESDGWVEVYADSSKKPDEYGQYAGFAMTVKGQDFEIDGNIFLFPVRQDKYLETEFIVVAYNDEKTSIRVRPDTDDRFAFLEVMTEINGRRERALDFSSMMPGARAHVGDAIYELHKDGWYLGETKISATKSR